MANEWVVMIENILHIILYTYHEYQFRRHTSARAILQYNHIFRLDYNLK